MRLAMFVRRIGIIGLLVISVFGGGSLIWLICPNPSIIYLII